MNVSCSIKKIDLNGGYYFSIYISTSIFPRLLPLTCQGLILPQVAKVRENDVPFRSFLTLDISDDKMTSLRASLLDVTITFVE